MYVCICLHVYVVEMVVGGFTQRYQFHTGGTFIGVGTEEDGGGGGGAGPSHNSEGGIAHSLAPLFQAQEFIQCRPRLNKVFMKT